MNYRGQILKLSEIIDLEYQLYMDSQSEPVKVRERDRKIGMEFPGDVKDRTSLFQYWLKRVDEEGSFPGRAVASGLAFLRYSVFILFLISGAAACAGVLSYDGSRPVNIVHFLAVFVGLSVLFYMLFIINLLTGPLHRKIPFIGDFYRFAGFLLSWAVRKTGSHIYRNRPESIRRITGLFYRAGSRHSLYSKIGKWTLFSITQAAGFAFSLGALISCVWLITFSDLAFAWNTTLDISPEMFHRIVRAVSLPWSVFSDECVPSLELVESTRFFRLDESYSASQVSALTAGEWWPFLVRSLIFYGVIPRLLFLALTGYMRARALAQAPFLSAELDSLNRRLSFPVVSTQTTSSQPARHPVQTGVVSGSESNEKFSSCSIILWSEIELSRDQIAHIAESGFHLKVQEILYAGMFDNEQDEKTLKYFAQTNGHEPVLILAESWEAPGKAIEYFLHRLRANIEDSRTILIGLLNMDSKGGLLTPEPADWMNWQEMALKLKDPFVSLEPVTGVNHE